MSSFWVFFTVGVLTGWPPAAAGMWLTWKLATRKVQQATNAQTAVIKDIADQQTGQILGLAPLPEPYKGYEQEPPAPASGASG